MAFTPFNDLEQIAGNPVNVGIGNTGTGTLRVVLASDQPVLTVTGGGGGGNSAAGPTGSAVPADADYIGVNISGDLVGVTGLSLGSTTRAATVAIVDGSGNQITTFGGGTQYSDGAAEATPVGTTALGFDGTDVWALRVDGSKNLKVSIQNSSIAVTGLFFQSTQPVSGNTNPAAGATGSTVPADADYIGFNSAGNLIGVSSSNPFPVAVISGGGSNASVGSTGTTAPTSATEMGFISAGNLVSPSTANPLPVTIVAGATSTIQFADPTTAILSRASINFSTVGSQTIIAGVTSQTIRIMRLFLVVAGTAANTIAFGDTTPAVLMPAVPVLPYASLQFQLDGEPYYITASGKGFTITSTVAAQVSGTVWYSQS